MTSGNIGTNYRKETIGMNQLINLVADKLNLPTGRVIYLAYEYAENVPHGKKQQRKIVRAIHNDELPPEVEDFVLDTLSGRSKPL